MDQGREVSERKYLVENGWVLGVPRYYQCPLADGVLDHWLQLEQTEKFPSGSQSRDERSPLSLPEQYQQATLRTTPDSSSVRDRNGDGAAFWFQSRKEKGAKRSTRRKG